MSKPSVEELDLATLVGQIATDAGSLVDQQMVLLRQELGQELQKAGVGFAQMAAGGGLAAAGGFLSGMMLVHLVQRLTRLPLWACYGIVGGGLSMASVRLLQEGGAKMADIQLLPPRESAKGLAENVAWLKDQLRPSSKET